MNFEKMLGRVVVVGAGVTGCGTAAFIRAALSPSAQVAITIWDKAQKPGGRMGTSRSRLPGTGTVDLGAQYISSTPDNFAQSAQVYEEFLSAGVLRPLTSTIVNDRQYSEGTRHFVAPQGIGSLPQHFLHKSGAEVRYKSHVTELQQDGGGGAWHVTCADGHTDTFDHVVLTLPPPQILQLGGSITDLLESGGLKEKLTAVEFSSRYAIALYFAPGTYLPFSWHVKYFPRDEKICYVAVDTAKRGAATEGVGPSLVVHSTVWFGLAHLESDRDATCETLMEHLRQLVPDLPAPVDVRNHRWRYSQIYTPYAGALGCVAVCPSLVLAGDAFVPSSGLDNCLRSSRAAAAAVLQALGVQ